MGEFNFLEREKDQRRGSPQLSLPSCSS